MNNAKVKYLLLTKVFFQKPISSFLTVEFSLVLRWNFFPLSWFLLNIRKILESLKFPQVSTIGSLKYWWFHSNLNDFFHLLFFNIEVPHWISEIWIFSIFSSKRKIQIQRPAIILPFTFESSSNSSFIDFVSFYKKHLIDFFLGKLFHIVFPQFFSIFTKAHSRVSIVVF